MPLIVEGERGRTPMSSSRIAWRRALAAFFRDLVASRMLRGATVRGAGG